MSSHKDAFWRANNPCWICRVSAGTARASIVAQSEQVIVLISPMPLTLGHTLVVPRRHIRDLYELPDELAGPILSIVVIICVIRWWSKPPRFQISLATNIALMFMAAVLIYFLAAYRGKGVRPGNQPAQ